MVNFPATEVGWHHLSLLQPSLLGYASINVNPPTSNPQKGRWWWIWPLGWGYWTFFVGAKHTYWRSKVVSHVPCLLSSLWSERMSFRYDTLLFLVLKRHRLYLETLSDFLVKTVGEWWQAQRRKCWWISCVTSARWSSLVVMPTSPSELLMSRRLLFHTTLHTTLHPPPLLPSQPGYPHFIFVLNFVSAWSSESGLTCLFKFKGCYSTKV